MNQQVIWDFMQRGINTQRKVGDITANFHKGNPESVVANPTPNHKVSQLRTILTVIRARGDATSEEIETDLGLSHQSVSARFADAKRLGLIVKVGKRLTKSGKNAGAWRVIEI